MNTRYLSQVELWRFKLIKLGESDFGFMTFYISDTLKVFSYGIYMTKIKSMCMYIHTDFIGLWTGIWAYFIEIMIVCIFSTWNLPVTLFLINFRSALGFGKVILNNGNQRFSSTVCQHQHVYLISFSLLIIYNIYTWNTFLVHRVCKGKVLADGN